MTTRISALPLAGALAFLAGCNNHVDIAPRPGPITVMTAAEVDVRADAVRNDPVAYIRRVRDQCAGLQQYTLLFTRVERRGLFNTLKGPEQIQCRFRRSPFSVRMQWLDEKIDYGESTYVAGQQGNMIRFIPRHGLFGLPPGLTKVELQTPVIWGESKRPITEWGLERLMEATLKSIAECEPRGGAVIEYRGVVKLQNSDRPVHYVHLSYPRDPRVASVQELYTDVGTDLPAGTVLRFADGRLDAAYLYEQVNTNVTLTDDDFILDVEREEARAKKEAPAAR